MPRENSVCKHGWLLPFMRIGNQDILSSPNLFHVLIHHFWFNIVHYEWLILPCVCSIRRTSAGLLSQQVLKLQKSMQVATEDHLFVCFRQVRNVNKHRTYMMEIDDCWKVCEKEQHFGYYFITINCWPIFISTLIIISSSSLS